MTTIRERLINTLWQGNCLPARGAEMLDGYRRVVLAEAAETDPWQRAVDGLNALVEAGIPVSITLDGVIENPAGDEAIVWDHAAERWVLTDADAAERRWTA
jgi:hypothetical protein